MGVPLLQPSRNACDAAGISEAVLLVQAGAVAGMRLFQNSSTCVEPV